VEDNKKEGIKIRSGEVTDKKKVSIVDCDIEDNGHNGILAETRRIVLIDNEIEGNKNDGVNLAGGTSAYLKDNEIIETNNEAYMEQYFMKLKFK
jgi:hypothetical protein